VVWAIFRAVILNKVGSKRALDDRPIRGDVGMSEREVEQFSIAKAIRAMADNDWQKSRIGTRGIEDDGKIPHTSEFFCPAK